MCPGRELNPHAHSARHFKCLMSTISSPGQVRGSIQEIEGFCKRLFFQVTKCEQSNRRHKNRTECVHKHIFLCIPDVTL